MKLSLLHEFKEIPEIEDDDYPLDDEENENDVAKDTRLKKRFVHKPPQMMDGELNRVDSHLGPTRARIDGGNSLA